VKKKAMTPGEVDAAIEQLRKSPLVASMTVGGLPVEPKPDRPVQVKPAAKKRKQPEGDFTKQVIALAQLHGWRVAHFRPAWVGEGENRRMVTPVQGDGKGFPDLILVRGKILLAAELKVGKNKVTPEQEIWLSAFDGVPGCYAMEWRPEDWDEIEERLCDDYTPP